MKSQWKRKIVQSLTELTRHGSVAIGATYLLLWLIIIKILLNIRFFFIENIKILFICQSILQVETVYKYMRPSDRN